MGQKSVSVPSIILLFFVSLSAGCGGGSFATIPPPLPAPDFSIALSTNSITIAQGATSLPVNVSISPLNGFTGSAQVTLGALPAGVTSTPASPFIVTSGASAAVLFSAASNAATGTFSVSAQATSGGLSHSANLALTVQSSAGSALPRSTYVKTDATSAADGLVGEPHRRHIAYDPANKHLFVANRAMNRVEVFSTSDQRRVAQIPVPGASSADLSADGATVWIGTSLEHIVAVDAATLRVRARSFVN